MKRPGESASRLIDERIKEVGDWRGKALAPDGVWVAGLSGLRLAGRPRGLQRTYCRSLRLTLFSLLRGKRAITEFQLRPFRALG